MPHWKQGVPVFKDFTQTVEFPSLSESWESVERGQTSPLSPGAYGNYSVKEEGVLELTPGEYYFRSLGVEPGGIVKVTGPAGGVFIYVKDNFTFRGKQGFEKSSHETLVVSFGQQVSVEAPFKGAIMAPEGTLALGGTTGQTFTGQFFGAYVELRNAATVRLKPFSYGLGLASGSGAVGDIELIELGFDIPEWIPLESLAVSAVDSLELEESVQVGAAVAATSGELSVGSSASVGSLSANASVTIGGQAVVAGDVHAGSSMLLDSTATVSGTVLAELGSVPTVHVGWHVTLPTVNLGSVSLEPDGARNLAPGRYGELSVGRDSTLILQTGVYGFDSAIVEPGATILLDDREGPVQLLIEGGFTFRGLVTSVGRGIPQGLFIVRGSQDVAIEASFEGALIAPDAFVHVQSGSPNGHRAFIVGRQVSLYSGTTLAPLPVDWGTVVGPDYAPEPDDAPVHGMLDNDLNLIIDIPAQGGTTTSSTATVGEPEVFTLPEQYTVAGGVIGNGTVVLRYGCGGSLETCTYRGLSSTSEPETAEELTKGSVVQFEGCSDGLPADAERTACTYELEVNPIPNYPVTVQPPMQRPNSCSEELELLTPEQTRQMREGFDWSAATHVPELDANDDPTLYYAWIHVRNAEEALALKKLYIHVLSRPFFDSELLQFAGRCGTFVNPGDGVGAFVLALGRTKPVTCAPTTPSPRLKLRSRISISTN